MSIEKKYFGNLPDGNEISSFRITLPNGAYAELLELGGILHRLCLPDREGKIENVVCGFGSVAEYLNDNNHHGAVIGRFANRIRDGKFKLNGKEYVLALNEKGTVHLHGGEMGFDRRKWQGKIVGPSTVRFSRVSPDGEEGYPGTLSLSVDYTFEKNVLTIRYMAKSDADTVVNLTNHSYFNLGGVGSGSVLNDYLRLDADRYSALDESLLPVGQPLEVEGTDFDFRAGKQIGRPFDNNLFFTANGSTERGELFCERSGRGLLLSTDMPNLQLYTAVVMRGEPFENGKEQVPLEAVCLETQFLPDGPNSEEIPGSLLRAGEQYDHTTSFTFFVR